MTQQNFLQQKGYRTLVLWTFWAAAAIAVYMTLYQDTEVWDFVEHDTTRVTWIIMALFLLGVVASFVLTVILTWEHIRVNELESDAAAGGLNGMQVSTTGRRAVDRFFAALRTVSRGSNTRPDVGTLTEIELATFSRISRTVELLGNILITLGLIGTVMGLTLTLTGLTGSLEALGQDQEELLQGLRQAMSGMGTAFYTTLLGAILGGVLLRVFAQINENGVEGLQDAMMRICLVHCAADLQPSLEQDLRFLDAQVEVLGKNVHALRNAFSESRTALDEFAQQMKEVHEKAWSDKDRSSVEEAIRAHREYTRLLRHEVELHTHLYGSSWDRLKAFVRRTIR